MPRRGISSFLGLDAGNNFIFGFAVGVPRGGFFELAFDVFVGAARERICDEFITKGYMFGDFWMRVLENVKMNVGRVFVCELEEAAAFDSEFAHGRVALLLQEVVLFVELR